LISTFACCRRRRALHSFPTRRSSDLVQDRERLLELGGEGEKREHDGDQGNRRGRGARREPRQDEDHDRPTQQPELRRQGEEVSEGSHAYPPPRVSRVITEKLMLSIRVAGRTPRSTISDTSPTPFTSSKVPRSRIRPWCSGRGPKRILWTVRIMTPATASTPSSASGVASRWPG